MLHTRWCCFIWNLTAPYWKFKRNATKKSRFCLWFCVLYSVSSWLNTFDREEIHIKMCFK